MADFLSAFRASGGNLSAGQALSALSTQFQRLPTNETKQPVSQVAPVPPVMDRHPGFAADPNAPAGVYTLGGSVVGSGNSTNVNTNMVGSPPAQDGMVTTTSLPGSKGPVVNPDGSVTHRVDDSGMGNDRYKIGGGFGGNGGFRGLDGLLQGNPALATGSAADLIAALRAKMDERNAWRGQWRDARDDWREQRPTLDAGETQDQFRQQMMEWIGQRPHRQDFRNGVPGNTGIVPPGTPNSTLPATTPAATAGNAAAHNPNLDPNYLQNFYATHGYYPGQGG